MKNRLKLAIPVMLHDATEVDAFKRAKPRIEGYLDSQGVPAEVGVFCYMAPFAIADESRRKAQISVQAKERFPVFHAQTPIIATHSLDYYGQDRNQALANGCLLETAIEHSAKLLEHSPVAFDADVHCGVFVYPEVCGNRVLGPATYTLDRFAQCREQILENTLAGFQTLERLARERGLGLLLENEPLASYEAGSIDGYRTARLIYKPFGVPSILQQVSPRRTFDVAHFASSLNVPQTFRKNAVDASGFLKMLGAEGEHSDDWSRYETEFCSAQSYIGKSPGAFHLSNFIGIGVHLDDAELRQKWGQDGTNEGRLSPGEMKGYLDIARQQDIPLVLEVDFDIPRIGQNHFIEADQFLRHVLQDS